MEKVVHKVGSAHMANFQIKFFSPEHATELIGYNSVLNKWMPEAKDKAWSEIHPFYPDQSDDARMVRHYPNFNHYAEKQTNM